MKQVDTTKRVPVSYIDKSRDYYLALGYGNPYRWAYHADVPFTPPVKPLPASRLALMTTAALNAEQGKFYDVYTAPLEPPPDSLYTDHLSWHKTATHTRDVGSFFPVRRLGEAVADGRLGRLNDRFYGIPTVFSQRRSTQEHAPAVLELCRRDEIDVALLVAL